MRTAVARNATAINGGIIAAAQFQRAKDLSEGQAAGGIWAG